jgi:hypothetical protein
MLMSTQTVDTDNELQKFWFQISNEQQWYSIIRECREWFGKNWKGQPKVRRKLGHIVSGRGGAPFLNVWFEVPDNRFATWVSVKYSIQVQSDAKYKNGK